MDKFEIRVGSVLFTLAIIFGAFGAHALKGIIDEQSLATFEVGVRYQFYQALGFLILGFSKDKLTYNLRPISMGMLIGLILFCGSIYAISLKELSPFSLSFLGPITPVGGIILILSWIKFIIKSFK